MNGFVSDSHFSNSQSVNNYIAQNMSSELYNGKIFRHLVGMPRVVLTRIDEGELPATLTKTSSLNKTSKKQDGKKSKISPLKTKKTVSKSPAVVFKVKSRIRHKKVLDFPVQSPKPKKDSIITKFSTLENSPLKSLKPQKKITTPKSQIRKGQHVPLKSLKSQKKIFSTKQENQAKKPQKKSLIAVDEKLIVRPIKNMLKKTMLQKKSKILIPTAKKTKSTPVKNSKQSVSKQKHLQTKIKTKKQVPLKIKIDKPLDKPVNTDTSEDEFLYDELIDDLESPFSKQIESVKPGAEKTTNITLKPNQGNKLPTVVKGGIIKKTNLPPDLKPIASINDDMKYNGPHSTITVEDKRKSTVSRKRTKPLNESVNASPTKKPSPWPVSISSSPKTSIESTQNKGNKKLNPPSKLNTTKGKSSNTQKISQKTNPKPVLSSSIDLPNLNDLGTKTSAIIKPKIGPKQTAKVVPISKSQVQDDNLSDEYTEEETLENIDSDSGDLFLKLSDEPTNDGSLVKDNVKVAKLQHNIKPISYDDSTRDDEDPHLDLLRILTDDSDEPAQFQYLDSKGKELQSDVNNVTNGSVIESEVETDISCVDSLGVEHNAESVVEEDPPPRTIYDLMNEISLQYPSWNLHIIPETSAFCIAQVTKGRLGLPTLKKCIELDPNDYNAKVYIHQYHIKRFDGVYDSEESIIALIQEINSIKA